MSTHVGDDDIDPNDLTYKADFKKWMFDGLMNDVFFRYTRPELPSSVAEPSSCLE